VQKQVHFLEEVLPVVSPSDNFFMPDNLDKYVPEFDEEDQRQRLAGFNRDDLIHMLLRAYKEKRVLAKMLDEFHAKFTRIQAVIEEPSALLKAPGVPGEDDLRKMME
jgi:hypothetical protein